MRYTFLILDDPYEDRPVDPDAIRLWFHKTFGRKLMFINIFDTDGLHNYHSNVTRVEITEDELGLVEAHVEFADEESRDYYSVARLEVRGAIDGD